MQVANTLNNYIRILFNPKIEAFQLFDFLMVKSGEDRYIAQILEIYEDKFDSSQNVAKLKLFYKVAQNNEVQPYDNFTPNKECEISKIKQEEIENFVNIDKETFPFATNAKNSTSLNVQYDFFNNNAIVLADKVENANILSLNLASKLSEKRNSVIIDCTGILEHDCATKITASKNFKMPLNFSTIDYVFDICLSTGSLEFQTIAGEIINELKRFAKKQPAEFIPFNLFTKVILEQYKATPYQELKFLLVQIQRFQMNSIFAKTKKDVEDLLKEVKKNKVTIIDLSTIDARWQKPYIEYIVDALDVDFNLIARINEENFDLDIINKIYNKKQNIKFVPNVSYNYKKLPSILQYCKNYILLPSLYQRNDFLDVNFALSNLISDGCILFGKNTDEFFYLACDYELTAQEKRKNYKKIVLTLVEKEDEEETKRNLGQRGDYFENLKHDSNKSDSQKLMDELSAFEKENAKKLEDTSEKEEFVELENPKAQQVDEPTEKTQAQEDELSQESIEDIINQSQTNDVENVEIEQTDASEEAETTEQTEDEKKEEEQNSSSILEEDKVQADEENKTELVFTDKVEKETVSEEVEVININNEEENVDFSDEELDFFQLAEETSPENNAVIQKEDEKKSTESIKVEQTKKDIDIIETNQIEKTKEIIVPKEDNVESQNNANDVAKEEHDEDLHNIADSSLDSTFENIISSKPEIKDKNIQDEPSINVDISTENEENTSLPIFKDEEEKQYVSKDVYAVGDKIMHKTYGKGQIIKIITHEEKQYLQIEFDDSGKKLLDPVIANIKIEQ